MAKNELTAAEKIAQLANDPKYQIMLRRKEELQKRQQEALALDQRKFVAECSAVGIQIQSVWDLVNSTSSYSQAIPVLVAHLNRPHLPRTVEGIVRALITPESQGLAFDSLVSVFKQTSIADLELKWLLGAAIAESATPSDLETIVELSKDLSHGQGREFLPLGLVVSATNRSLSILEVMSNDPALAKNAKKAIKLIRTRMNKQKRES